MPAEFTDRAGQQEIVADFGSALAQASILVVDDEPGIRNFLVKIFRERCQLVDVAADAAEASRKLDMQHFDVVVLDNVMPGTNGLEWLAQQRATGFFTDVILMTAYADLDTAIDALRIGVVDFVVKPFRSNQLLSAVARCLDRTRLQRENSVLRHELSAAAGEIQLRDKLIGESAAIRQVRDAIARVAPIPTSVLITGESGTGKEVAARSLHALSDRADKLFVPINCGAIPADMIESELFGHLKGSFTGATRSREGLLMHAQGGTVFLDEIADKLGDLDEGYRESAAFFAALAEHDLIEPFTLEVTLDDGSLNSLVGFHVIDEARLRALDTAALGALHAAGHLMPIFMAVASLAQLKSLVDRKNRRQRDG